MFHCEHPEHKGATLTGPGVTPRRVPVEVRKVAYTTILPGGKKYGTQKIESRGTEIVREAILCPTCSMPKPIMVAGDSKVVVNDLTKKAA